jgi:hypothetical protein
LPSPYSLRFRSSLDSPWHHENLQRLSHDFRIYQANCAVAYGISRPSPSRASSAFGSAKVPTSSSSRGTRPAKYPTHSPSWRPAANLITKYTGHSPQHCKSFGMIGPHKMSTVGRSKVRRMLKMTPTRCSRRLSPKWTPPSSFSTRKETYYPCGSPMLGNSGNSRNVPAKRETAQGSTARIRIRTPYAERSLFHGCPPFNILGWRWAHCSAIGTHINENRCPSIPGCFRASARLAW